MVVRVLKNRQCIKPITSFWKYIVTFSSLSNVMHDIPFKVIEHQLQQINYVKKTKRFCIRRVVFIFHFEINFETQLLCQQHEVFLKLYFKLRFA